MKKQLFLLLTCITCFTACFSQTKEKGFFSVSVGPAFPTRKFASDAGTDPLAGWAKTGEAISVSYSKMLSSYIGFALQLQAQRNPVNTSVLKKNLDGLTGYDNWSFDKASWLYGSLLAGPESQMPLDKTGKLHLVARIMAGIAYARSPGVSGQNKTANTAGNMQQDKKTATGFILNTMAGLNYSTSNRIFLTAALSYSGTNNVTFKEIKTTITTSQGTPGSLEYRIQQTSALITRKQSISSINVMLGIGFRL